MTPDKCPDHGLPWKWVPAGTSKKTGQPYPGFHTCPERGCQQRPKPDAPATPQSPPAASPARSGAGAVPGGADPQRHGIMLECIRAAAQAHSGQGPMGLVDTAGELFRAAMAGFPRPKMTDGSWEPVDDVPNFD